MLFPLTKLIYLCHARAPSIKINCEPSDCSNEANIVVSSSVIVYYAQTTPFVMVHGYLP